MYNIIFVQVCFLLLNNTMLFPYYVICVLLIVEGGTVTYSPKQVKSQKY